MNTRDFDRAVEYVRSAEAAYEDLATERDTLAEENQTLKERIEALEQEIADVNLAKAYPGDDL